VLGMGAAWTLFPAQASLVGVFLASLLCLDGTERILENRSCSLQQDPSQLRSSNRTAVWQTTALFAGAIAGFSVLGLKLTLPTAHAMFGAQLVDYGPLLFPELHFGDLQGLIRNNVYVLVFFLVLGVPFRVGGLLFAILWNASVWGASFAVVARRWAGATDGLDTLEAWLRVSAACTPHMAIEALGYAAGGLAGVLIGRALLWGRSTQDPLPREVFSGLALAATGMALVLSGAAFEAHVTGRLVAWFSAGVG